jgi:hypothetical protein
MQNGECLSPRCARRVKGYAYQHFVSQMPSGVAMTPA